MAVFEVSELKMPKMEQNEIKQLLSEQFLCRIAFKGKYPYIAPFQYVLLNDTMYFHFTDYGKKMVFFKKETPVCVEVERYTTDLSDYQFVVLIGKLKKVENIVERNRAIQKMAEIGKQKLSINFLAAHGLPKDSDWEDFTPEKAILIIKLEQVTEMTGLKSP